MGRSEELVRRTRRAARSVLDRGSAAVDRAGTIVRDRLARRGQDDHRPPPSIRSVPPAPQRPAAEPARAAFELDLEALTKAELYSLARERDISGRSKLSKDELVRALQSVSD